MFFRLPLFFFREVVITDNGFIKIPRAVEKCRELQDPLNFYVYVKLMMMARFRETTIEGIDVNVNQILISKQRLSDKLNIKLSQVRSILATFERIGGIETENIKNRFTRITILPLFLEGKQNTCTMLPEKKGKDAREERPASVAAENNKKPEADIKPFTNPAEFMHSSDIKTESNEKINCKPSAEVISFKDAMNDEDGICLQNKTLYGEFLNVRLNEAEYDRICAVSPNPEYFINCLSLDLASGKVTDSENHYLLIFRHIENDKKKHPENYTPKAIQAARRARELDEIERRNRNSVPKLKKRIR